MWRLCHGINSLPTSRHDDLHCLHFIRWNVPIQSFVGWGGWCHSATLFMVLSTFCYARMDGRNISLPMGRETSDLGKRGANFLRKQSMRETETPVFFWAKKNKNIINYLQNGRKVQHSFLLQTSNTAEFTERVALSPPCANCHWLERDKLQRKPIQLTCVVVAIFLHALKIHGVCGRGS